MNAEKEIIIVVSKSNQLVDWGNPDCFTEFMMKRYFKAGHIIRYVTEAQFEQSPLKPKTDGI